MNYMNCTANRTTISVTNKLIIVKYLQATPFPKKNRIEKNNKQGDFTVVHYVAQAYVSANIGLHSFDKQRILSLSGHENNIQDHIDNKETN